MTVRGEKRAEITIKRSLFLACLLPVSNKSAAMAALDERRAEFFNANHHCFAYRLGRTGMEYRMSDDGEPSGSAGKPILFCLQRSGLSDALVVVVRWFGGVKLGVGGLARAYSEAANAVLALAESVPVVRRTAMTVHCGYDDVQRVTSVLELYDVIPQPFFADSVVFEVMIAESQADECTARIVDATSGRAGVSRRH